MPPRPFCMKKVKSLTLSAPAQTPDSLRPFFQEYKFEDLHPAQHGELVIERTLAYGNRVEIRWLFDTYGAAQITAWLARFGAQRLPWRRYNLWCVLLELPPAQRLRPEANRIWPY